MDILIKRYARGKLTREAFEPMKEDLECWARGVGVLWAFPHHKPSILCPAQKRSLISEVA
ncbi:hypothetical protein ACMDCT_11245 [Halomonadaceae bacterium KBTZ08]